MLSMPHLIVIFLVALVIFGPQKLPELARMLGKATAEFRRMTSDFRLALENEVNDLDRQARIREEEVAAANMPPTTKPAEEPMGTIARSPSFSDQLSQAQPDFHAHSNPDPAPAPQSEIVSPPEHEPSETKEKPTDDTTAV